MKKRRTGLQDIADHVGVSKMTISRFLRDPDWVSVPLQERIAEVIERLGYLPNKAPNMLSNARSYAIGVFVPSLTNQVFAEILHGIENVTDNEGYHTMIVHTGYDKRKEENKLRSLLAYNVDGLILTERTHTEATLKMIKLANIPVVEIMDSVSDYIDMAVGYDNFNAAKAMTNKMITAGKKKIVYFGARMDERSLIRQKGYEEAMREQGLEHYTFSSKVASSFTLGGQLLQQALMVFPDIEGVFCSNDTLAAGVLFECQRQNIAVPDQLAIAGFHGLDVGQALTPKLATVLTPRQKMGEIAAKMLIKRLNGKTLNSLVVDLPVDYLVGASIG